MSSFKIIFIGLIFSLSCFISAGTISGHITNKKDNSPIPGADVILLGTYLGASADSLGFYIINNVPGGDYKIKAAAIGYKNEVENVTIKNSNSKIEMDFLLHEEAVTLSEIVIKARANRELETAARETERNAGNVVNVISAQTIQQSTDRTAADALQRVSGMSLIRDNSGEGRYVVMRGLSQQYNNTLVDGIKIPSPESKDRFVPMDIFPSGLFGRIEVVKSLTPDIAGDAIGGSTDLMLREAPDKFTFTFSAATGVSSALLNNSFNSFDKSTVNQLDPERLHGTVSDSDPTTQIKTRYNPSPSDFAVNNLKFNDKAVRPEGLFSGLVGDRFFDGKIGLMAAGSYQNTYNRVESDIYSVGSNINKLDDEGHLVPYASTFNNQIYNINKIRSGTVLKADFIGSQEHELTAMYMYVHQEEDQTRHALQINISGSRGSNDLTYTHRSALRTQNISSVSLSGNNFNTSPFKLRWTLNYTDAVQDRPDEAEYSLLQNYDVNGNLQNFQGLGSINHSWRKNDDNQYLGKLDAVFHITSDGTNTIQARYSCSEA